MKYLQTMSLKFYDVNFAKLQWKMVWVPFFFWKALSKRLPRAFYKIWFSKVNSFFIRRLTYHSIFGFSKVFGRIRQVFLKCAGKLWSLRTPIPTKNNSRNPRELTFALRHLTKPVETLRTEGVGLGELGTVGLGFIKFFIFGTILLVQLHGSSS